MEEDHFVFSFINHYPFVYKQNVFWLFSAVINHLVNTYEEGEICLSDKNLKIYRRDLMIFREKRLSNSGLNANCGSRKLRGVLN